VSYRDHHKLRSEISRVPNTFPHRRDSSHTNEALGKHNLDAVRPSLDLEAGVDGDDGGN
jgi:hypothetical protein